jgi:carbon starvation protein
MCGALSGFHALIASGTTPKMLYRESDIRVIGYGAMVLEGFVAVTALVAACTLQPADYFAINVAQDTPAQKSAYVQMVRTQAEHGWDLTPKGLPELERETGEKLVGRVGGAVTLAVGMASVFSKFMKGLAGYWYHFVIMFEALFILTLLETGTRVARFVFQESMAEFSPRAKVDGKPPWGMNILMSFLTCCAWGYLLYTGNINTLWRMLGISNQLLAAIALAVGTTYLLNHASKRSYALCTGIPFVFVIVTVLTASVQSVLGWWKKIGLDHVGAHRRDCGRCDSKMEEHPGDAFRVRRADSCYRNSLMERFLKKGISSIPATNPPTCAQKATPPLASILRTASPLSSCIPNQKTRRRRAGM